MVPAYERIWGQMMSDELGRSFVDNVTAGFELVRKYPGYAFVTERTTIDYYLTRKGYCGLIKVEGNLNQVG